MLLTLLLAALAHGESFQVPEFRMAAIRKAYREPVPETSLCTALDQLSEAKFPAKPPASCPKTLEYWNLLTDLDSANREACHDISDFLLSELRDSALCENPHGKNSRLGKAIEKFHRLNEPVDRAVDQLNPSAAKEEIEESVYNKTKKGELGNPACLAVAEALYAFRYRHAFFAEMHWCDADRALRNACKPGGEDKEFYLREVEPGGKVAPRDWAHPFP